MKQTAVEWLLQEMSKLNNSQPTEAMIMYAKKLEKQQIMNAVYDSMGTNFDANMGRAKLYYDTTFKQD